MGCQQPIEGCIKAAQSCPRQRQPPPASMGSRSLHSGQPKSSIHLARLAVPTSHQVKIFDVAIASLDEGLMRTGSMGLVAINDIFAGLDSGECVKVAELALSVGVSPLHWLHSELINILGSAMRYRKGPLLNVAMRVSQSLQSLRPLSAASSGRRVCIAQSLLGHTGLMVLINVSAVGTDLVPDAAYGITVD